MRYQLPSITALALLLVSCRPTSTSSEASSPNAQDRRIQRVAQDPPIQPESSQGRRVALVAGNDAYPTMPLRNAVNDARSMAAALSELGFDVDKVENVDGSALENAVDRLIGRLGAGDVGLFFFAGHGMQIEGLNYLIPTDFEAEDETKAKWRSLAADEVRERMESSGSRLNILVLDACRDNPFRGSRSGSRGLAAMSGGRGTLVALATAPGKTASDNLAGSNGLFTHHLLQVLRMPGLDIEQVFKVTRVQVDEASGHKQVPWVVSSVIGDFYFQPGQPAVSLAPAPTPRIDVQPEDPPEAGGPPTGAQEQAAVPAARQRFFEDPQLLEKARAWVDRLQRQAAESLAPPSSSGPVPSCSAADAPGCTRLGVMYWRGQGVAQDYAEAARLYRQGCDGGDAAGCTNLGLMHYGGHGVSQDMEKAFLLWRQGCEGGDADGCRYRDSWAY